MDLKIKKKEELQHLLSIRAKRRREEAIRKMKRMRTMKKEEYHRLFR